MFYNISVLKQLIENSCEYYNVCFQFISDGSLLYERVPNKQEAAAAAAAAAAALNNPSAAAAAAAAVGLNPATAAAILGALGPPGSIASGSANAPGSSNDPSATGFDVAAAAAALYQQQQGSTSSSNKRRLYETDSGEYKINHQKCNCSIYRVKKQNQNKILIMITLHYFEY